MKSIIKSVIIGTMVLLPVQNAMPQTSAIRFPKQRGASVGIVVRNLATGKDVVTENPDRLLTPASILKCVTAAAAILDGRESNVFLTETLISGETGIDGTLYGDVIIKGIGDPTTESPQFPESCGMADSIAGRLQQRGIRHIAGGITIDSIGFKNQGPVGKWEVEDLKWAYGAGLYPLNFQDNTSGVDRALSDPGETFVDALESRLLCDSVKVDWNEAGMFASSTTPLYAHRSPTVAKILRVMMEKSNNMYAEGMLRMLAPGEAMDVALKREREILSNAGFDCDGMSVFDGSGLTRNSKVSPRFMADLLQYMATGENGKLYVSLFPKVGLEGTVKRLLKNTVLEGRLVLKSGSMNGVQCFAGYKIGTDGTPTHVIVIMVNDFICKRALVNKGISDFLLKRF